MDISPLLNTAAVTHVRLIDVVEMAQLCSSGDVIYDPSPTEGSAGFDLDGIGVLNQIEFERDLVDFEDVGAGLIPRIISTVLIRMAPCYRPYDDVVVLEIFDRITDFHILTRLILTHGINGHSNKTDTVTAGYLNQFSVSRC